MKEAKKKIICKFCNLGIATWRYQESGLPEICTECRDDAHNPLSWVCVGEADQCKSTS